MTKTDAALKEKWNAMLCRWFGHRTKWRYDCMGECGRCGLKWGPCEECLQEWFEGDGSTT